MANAIRDCFCQNQTSNQWMSKVKETIQKNIKDDTNYQTPQTRNFLSQLTLSKIEKM